MLAETGFDNAVVSIAKKIDECDVVDDRNNGSPPKRKRFWMDIEVRNDCPFLDTINRQVLDFDLAKRCSVSLYTYGVYACLVCGKYFSGTWVLSPAYMHSVNAEHRMFINLDTQNIYCLPCDYEVEHPSLDGIRHVLNPRFSRDQVLQLDTNTQWSTALDGSHYLPGTVGLKNNNDTDYINVTIQSLMRVTPLRNFFLIPENYINCESELVQRFGELTRKIWHANNFKGQVSPYQFVLAVSKASKKRYRIGVTSDPADFMTWLLKTLHTDLKGSSKIVQQCFQGEWEITKEYLVGDDAISRETEDGQDGELEIVNNVVSETRRFRFWILGMHLPPPPQPLSKDVIPQVPLLDILKKFDGETVTEEVSPFMERTRYRMLRLPQYLILHMRRFKKNGSVVEKNPTLVNTSVKNLELKKLLSPAPTDKEEESRYDLIANIVHDGKPGGGLPFSVAVHRKSQDLWYEMRDLRVTEILQDTVALSEANIQIYEQHQQPTQ